jgi:hypothetical protein
MEVVEKMAKELVVVALEIFGLVVLVSAKFLPMNPIEKSSSYIYYIHLKNLYIYLRLDYNLLAGIQLLLY